MVSDRLAARAGRPAFVFAHRGASALAPENSLESFLLAVELGADGVELDVQLSADGIPVVLHDPFLYHDAERTYLRPGPQAAGLRRRWVARSSWSELDGLEVTHPNGATATIPRLEEVLEAVGGRVLVDVELKAGAIEDPRLVEVVLACLADQPVDVVVSSFDHRALAEVARRAPQLPLLAILHARPIDLAALAAGIPASLVSIDRPFLTRADAARWRYEGLAVLVGGRDLVDDLDEVCSWPVDAVFLDDPRLRDPPAGGQAGAS